MTSSARGRPASKPPKGGQIKSRQRVRDLAEVYTHQREVNAMLDLVTDMFPSEADPENTDRLFLEPSCGSGNFLVEILARKLVYATPTRYGRSEALEHRILRCLASIYGIDVCDENVATARERISNVIGTHIDHYLRGAAPTPGFLSAVKTILGTNIICADTLGDAAKIELVEYAPVDNGRFIREWSHPLDPAADEPTLFSLAAPRRDAVPMHYSELESQPGPVAPRLVERVAA